MPCPEKKRSLSVEGNMHLPQNFETIPIFGKEQGIEREILFGRLRAGIPEMESRLLRLSKKWLCRFFEKASLRSAPRLSAYSGQFDAHSAQSVFRRAQVAAENRFYSFHVCGRETLRDFFNKLESRDSISGIPALFSAFRKRERGRPAVRFRSRRGRRGRASFSCGGRGRQSRSRTPASAPASQRWKCSCRRSW